MKVFGDSEIIVKQIRNQIHCISPHLKAYQKEVWDLLKGFYAFNIVSIPRLKNATADLLAPQLRGLCPLIISALLNCFSGPRFQI